MVQSEWSEIKSGFRYRSTYEPAIERDGLEIEIVDWDAAEAAFAANYRRLRPAFEDAKARGASRGWCVDR